MFFIDNHSDFKITHRPHLSPAKGDILFIYDDSKIGLTVTNTLPLYEEYLFNIPQAYCFGSIKDQQCFLLDSLKNSILPSLQFHDAKLSFNFLAEELYQAVAIGHQLNYFRTTHRFCGKCGTNLDDKLDELAFICNHCQYITYPKISPCVIVLITRGEDMLLARSPHFSHQVMSTLAGFVSIGESAEQAVIREIREEVGVEVKNLKYICSQAWPFPGSLMFGFTAEYLSGEIIIDHHEIEMANWFNKKHLPILPNKMSIARYLIDQHLNAAEE